MSSLAAVGPALERTLRQHALLVVALVAIAAAGASIAVQMVLTELISTTRAQYVQSSRSEAVAARAQVSEAMRSVYRTLRTIARLPGVRSIGEQPVNLSEDARHAMRELYLNLSDSIDVSEIYVASRDFDPDALDPRTGEPQQPSITFDDNIVGRHAGPELVRVPEIEIHEYRLMVEQINRFATRYPKLDSIVQLGYPGAGGPEVVTCDNRRFSPDAPDDRDRSGYVYSVPFYAHTGEFAGIVSAVMLTSSIARLLPSGDFALRNRAHEYTVVGAAGGRAERSAQWVDRGVRDPALIYSEVLPLAVAESGSGWVLWAGRDDSNSAYASQVERYRFVTLLSHLGIILVTALIILFIRTKSQQTRVLERHVRDRTQELVRANTALQAARERERQFTDNAAHELRTPLTALSALAQAALRLEDPAELKPRLQKIRLAVNRAGRLIEQLLALARLDPLQSAVQSPEHFDVVPVAREVMIACFEDAEHKQQSLVMNAPEHAWIAGESELLRIMLQNLVNNAVRYTPHGGHVTLSVVTSPQRVSIEVTDDGPGIAPAHRPLVVERFFRVPGSGEPGSGLGLSIVARIVDLLNGTLSIADGNDRRGTRVNVAFQRVEPACQARRIKPRS